MTKEEERQYLDIAWEKIGNWVKDNCAFSENKRIRFPHDTYTWWNLEIFTTGDCAVMRGTHDSNCPEYLVHRGDCLMFSNGIYGHSWSDRYPVEKLEDFKRGDYTAYSNSAFSNNVKYSLLRKLVDNWDFVKNEINIELIKENNLVNFEA